MQTLMIRPVTIEDHGQLMALARLAGFGMTSLPQDEAVMHRKIERAAQSFAGKPTSPDRHAFLLVLEDTATGRIVGSTGIKAHVGLSDPFYSYKLSTLVQANRELRIYTRQKVLHMVNDFTGATEIGALFLHEQYRRNALGTFLSRVRFLMMAQFPDLFEDIVVAEIRGFHDAEGNSPFYDNVARHFFQMTFSQADYIYATKGNQFISDLMPRYPIYVTLLPQAAQAVIGKPHAASQPAARILMEEGFYYEDYVDLFDAGPTLQGERGRIATICGSKSMPVAAIGPVVSDTRRMIGNTVLENLRYVQDILHENPDGTVVITPGVAQRLQVQKGDNVRFAPLFPFAREAVQTGGCAP
jgi:arginine N-succinyltransferase